MEENSKLKNINMLARRRGKPDYVAPDGSETYVLVQMPQGEVSYFEFAAHKISKSVKHKSASRLPPAGSTTEIWYFLHGSGQIWRMMEEEEDTTDIRQGLTINIPAGCHFQFKSFDTPLKFIISGFPAWPGPEEAVSVEGKWPMAPEQAKI